MRRLSQIIVELWPSHWAHRQRCRRPTFLSDRLLPALEYISRNFRPWVRGRTGNLLLQKIILVPFKLSLLLLWNLRCFNLILRQKAYILNISSLRQFLRPKVYAFEALLSLLLDFHSLVPKIILRRRRRRLTDFFHQVLKVSLLAWKNILALT
jgi:hypothetical protein